MKGLFGYPGNNETFQQSEYDPAYYDPRTGSSYKKVTHNCKFHLSKMSILEQS